MKGDVHDRSSGGKGGGTEKVTDVEESDEALGSGEHAGEAGRVEFRQAVVGRWQQVLVGGEDVADRVDQDADQVIAGAVGVRGRRGEAGEFAGGSSTPRRAIMPRPLRPIPIAFAFTTAWAKRKTILHQQLELNQLPVGTCVSDAGRDQQREVKEAVAKLPVESRELIHLHYFAQLSYDEISQLLGLTPSAIHGRLQRARRRLRELMRTST